MGTAVGVAAAEAIGDAVGVAAPAAGELAVAVAVADARGVAVGLVPLGGALAAAVFDALGTEVDGADAAVGVEPPPPPEHPTIGTRNAIDT